MNAQLVRLALLTLTTSSFAFACTVEPPREPYASSTSSIDRAEPPDTDKDGTPDTEDCDPQSSKLGARVVEDTLATANGLIAAAPDFNNGSWGHANGGWRQQSVRNGGDASFFVTPLDGSDLVIEAKASLTKTGDFYTTLRQDFVIVGAQSTGDDFSAYGCGIELVEGATWEAKASIVKLSGSANAIQTSPIKRADRDYVELGEELDIKVQLTAGTLTCTVTQANNTTTVVALDVGTLTGSAGFYTRQSAAIFKDARICKIPSTVVDVKPSPPEPAPAPAPEGT